MPASPVARRGAALARREGSSVKQAGSNALVVPVVRAGERLAPEPSFADEVAALQFWRGRGVVQLVGADLPAGAMLLERLDGSHRAEHLPVEAGVAVIASIVRHLAVEPPPDATRTSDVVRARLIELEADWEHLERPFPRRTLDAVVDAARALTTWPIRVSRGRSRAAAARRGGGGPVR